MTTWMLTKVVSLGSVSGCQKDYLKSYEPDNHRLVKMTNLDMEKGCQRLSVWGPSTFVKGQPNICQIDNFLTNFIQLFF